MKLMVSGSLAGVESKLVIVETKLGKRIDDLDLKLGKRIDNLGSRIDNLDLKIGKRMDDLDLKIGKRMDDLDFKLDRMLVYQQQRDLISVATSVLLSVFSASYLKVSRR